jgi:hypothetical protein
MLEIVLKKCSGTNPDSTNEEFKLQIDDQEINSKSGCC